jgi:hypothetical protein
METLVNSARGDLSEAMQRFMDEFCTRHPFPYNSQEDMLMWYKLRNEVPPALREEDGHVQPSGQTNNG